jgi:hypothetical protein
MGFPDTYRFEVSDMQAYKQFGNSVVVPLVYDIARAMIEKLTNEKKFMPKELRNYKFVLGDKYEPTLFGLNEGIPFTKHQ